MRLLASYAALALGSLFCTVSYAAEAEKEPPQGCRSKTPHEIVDLHDEDVQGFVQTGVVPARLAGHLVRGEEGKATRWMEYRSKDISGYVPEGFAAERYEETTLEIFSVRMSGATLERLVGAIGKGQLKGFNAITVAVSVVNGQANLGSALSGATDKRIGFIDSDLEGLSLVSASVAGGGISFSREVSFQCVRAKLVDLHRSTFSKTLSMWNVGAHGLFAANATFANGAYLSRVTAKSLDFEEAQFEGPLGLKVHSVKAEELAVSSFKCNTSDEVQSQH